MKSISGCYKVHTSYSSQNLVGPCSESIYSSFIRCPSNLIVLFARLACIQRGKLEQISKNIDDKKKQKLQRETENFKRTRTTSMPRVKHIVYAQ